jgi:hypothetical protein
VSLSDSAEDLWPGSLIDSAEDLWPGSLMDSAEDVLPAADTILSPCRGVAEAADFEAVLAP